MCIENVWKKRDASSRWEGRAHFAWTRAREAWIHKGGRPKIGRIWVITTIFNQSDGDKVTISSWSSVHRITSRKVWWIRDAASTGMSFIWGSFKWGETPITRLKTSCMSCLTRRFISDPMRWKRAISGRTSCINHRRKHTHKKKITQGRKRSANTRIHTHKPHKQTHNTSTRFPAHRQVLRVGWRSSYWTTKVRPWLT